MSATELPPNFITTRDMATPHEKDYTSRGSGDETQLKESARLESRLSATIVELIVAPSLPTLFEAGNELFTIFAAVEELWINRSHELYQTLDETDALLGEGIKANSRGLNHVLLDSIFGALKQAHLNAFAGWNKSETVLAVAISHRFGVTERIHGSLRIH